VGVLGVNVMAASMPIETRAVMHLSKSAWDSNKRVKVTLYYSYQDTTESIVGLRGASIANYNYPISKAEIIQYAYYSGRTSAYIDVRVKIFGSSSWSTIRVNFNDLTP
jgi:hypothetical protein